MGSIKEAQFKIKTEQLKRKTSNKGQKLFEVTNYLKQF